MKKIIQKIKRMSLFQIGGVLLVLGVLIVYIMTRYVDDPIDPATRLVNNAVKTVKDNLGQVRQQQETTRAPLATGINQSDYDSLKKALKLKDNEIMAITNINAKLKDSVSLARMERDEANNKVWTWEKTTSSGSVVKATMNEKDSILHPEIDLKLNTTDYVDKGGIFGKDRYYTDWYSPDQNIKVNGAQTWRKETIVKPKRFGLGFQAGYGITQDLKPSMYIGVGVSYNIANF